MAVSLTDSMSVWIEIVILNSKLLRACCMVFIRQVFSMDKIYYSILQKIYIDYWRETEYTECIKTEL